MPVTIDYRIQTQQYESHVTWLPGGKREIPGLTWADILRILHDHHGLPIKFYTQDFLTTMLFTVDDAGTQLTAVWCSQGRRRGEVLLSIPATAPDAAAIMQRLGAAIEHYQQAQRAAAIQSGIPDSYYDDRARDDDDDLEF